MSYLFTFPNPAYEYLVKTEMKIFYPDFRLAYSAPGFVTFKCDHKLPKIFPFFSRLTGECLGGGDAQKGEIAYRERNKTWRLRPFTGQLLFDEPWNLAPVELDPLAPSRAYLKMAEIDRLIKIPFMSSQEVLEWGASPGGISHCLCQKKLSVTAVDPAEIKYQHQLFKHLQITIQDHQPQPIFDWLVCDVNLKMPIIIEEFKRKNTDFIRRLRGFFITNKIHHEHEIKKIPTYIKQLAQLGFSVKAQLLPSHHQEILIYGFRA